MNKDYLVSPSNDKLLKSSVNNLFEARKYNVQIINSVRASSSIVEETIAQQKQMMEAINSSIPKMNTLAIASDLIKQMDYAKIIGEDLQKTIISSQVAQVSELTKNITQVLDNLKYSITPNVFTYQTEISKMVSSIQSMYPDINLSDSSPSISENQKIDIKKYEINNTNTYAEKNYNPLVQESDDIKKLGFLLEKFLISYQIAKKISSHTYTLASENKIALTLYANSFTLLVEYIANITNPVLVSLSLSIITTAIIHLTDKN
ncbi:hypothetical protein [Lactococcus formosensis]|uniref:Uncharacterized protein n=1 Tax=Lactococcus formosensis TaxID=1281486 RepID=A0A9X4SBV7_9LACT|nr:hypothetical protein [Lactococcus formosensis]MDG6126412.1 hypothetical protein [Lactococcus formosensis]MDG6131900.1 hypothetical protein [Lactococcus formosensis]MDG6133897.1 hypothetical protein [Lactococcus formosensis]MDG6140477.1 hypothetical protein [Lactococcus formosensis]MDG6145019.1 hypothetical protein [Lactococcus formosensis]